MQHQRSTERPVGFDEGYRPVRAVIDVSRSPAAQCRPLGLTDVRLAPDGFWGARQRTNREVTIPSEYEQLSRAGNIHDIRLAAGMVEGDYRGPRYIDSDLYKWMEAAAYTLATHPDPTIDAWLDEIIEVLAQAQLPSGYLNSYYQVVRPNDLWADIDHGHQLYCAGHLIHAAVAHHRCTGKSSFLEVAQKLAECLDATFGPGKATAAPGHPEIEMALVELARETGEARYTALAKFFLDARGTPQSQCNGSEYLQDHVRVRETQHVAGHAVRQLYLLAGAMDIYLETAEQELLDMCQRVWQDMTITRLHLHGGVGSRHEGEAFGDAYELPSDRTYSETCAQVASVLWSWRLLLATGAGRYAGLIERTLYNGFLSGISLEGTQFFYPNPLQSCGGIERHPWFQCACCPPNIARTLASIGQYMAVTDDAGVAIHLYDRCTIDTPFAQLRIDTNYPWEGHVRIQIAQPVAQKWTLRLRVPDWCSRTSFALNGESLQPDRLANGLAEFDRPWTEGDVLDFDMTFSPRLTEAHPLVDSLRGCVAIERGPLVYCIEQAGANREIDVHNLAIDPQGQFSSRSAEDLPDEVVAIETLAAIADRSDWNNTLYRTRRTARTMWDHRRVEAVPYYLWANRGGVPMRTWFPLKSDA